MNFYLILIYIVLGLDIVELFIPEVKVSYNVIIKHVNLSEVTKFNYDRKTKRLAVKMLPKIGVLCLLRGTSWDYNVKWGNNWFNIDF